MLSKRSQHTASQESKLSEPIGIIHLVVTAKFSSVSYLLDFILLCVSRGHGLHHQVLHSLSELYILNIMKETQRAQSELNKLLFQVSMDFVTFCSAEDVTFSCSSGAMIFMLRTKRLSNVKIWFIFFTLETSPNSNSWGQLLWLLECEGMSTGTGSCLRGIDPV